MSTRSRLPTTRRWRLRSFDRIRSHRRPTSPKQLHSRRLTRRQSTARNGCQGPGPLRCHLCHGRHKQCSRPGPCRRCAMGHNPAEQAAQAAAKMLAAQGDSANAIANASLVGVTDTANTLNANAQAAYQLAKPQLHCSRRSAQAALAASQDAAGVQIATAQQQLATTQANAPDHRSQVVGHLQRRSGDSEHAVRWWLRRERLRAAWRRPVRVRRCSRVGIAHSNSLGG